MITFQRPENYVLTLCASTGTMARQLPTRQRCKTRPGGRIGSMRRRANSLGWRLYQVMHVPERGIARFVRKETSACVLRRPDSAYVRKFSTQLL